MNQLYDIDEIVLRQATTYTDHNGEYKIIGVISAEEMKQLHPFMKVVSGWYYELDGLAIDLTEYTGGSICNHSLESNLRKIHKPSELSFTELMTNLSTKIQERI